MGTDLKSYRDLEYQQYAYNTAMSNPRPNPPKPDHGIKWTASNDLEDLKHRSQILAKKIKGLRKSQEFFNEAGSSARYLQDAIYYNQNLSTDQKHSEMKLAHQFQADRLQREILKSRALRRSREYVDQIRTSTFISKVEERRRDRRK